MFVQTRHRAAVSDRQHQIRIRELGHEVDAFMEERRNVQETLPSTSSSSFQTFDFSHDYHQRTLSRRCLSPFLLVEDKCRGVRLLSDARPFLFTIVQGRGGMSFRCQCSDRLRKKSKDISRVHFLPDSCFPPLSLPLIFFFDLLCFGLLLWPAPHPPL